MRDYLIGGDGITVIFTTVDGMIYRKMLSDSASAKTLVFNGITAGPPQYSHALNGGSVIYRNPDDGKMYAKSASDHSQN